MNWRLLRDAAFDSFWNWLLGGVFTIFSAITFFIPSLQPALNFPALSTLLSPFALLTIGFIIWLLGFAWNVRKRLHNKTKDHEKHSARVENRVESTDQSGGITGNINARDVYTGGIHFHGDIGKLKEQRQEEPYKGSIEDYAREYGKPYQIRIGDTFKKISKKTYGNVKYVSYIQEANNEMSTPPPKGSYINLPSVINLVPKSREEGQYASIRVETKNADYPVFVSAFVSKALWWDEEESNWVDKTDKLGDDERYLSWHKGSDNPEKEVKPDVGGIINIAHFTDSGTMNFTMFYPKARLWAGSYKLWIVVKWCRSNKNSKYHTEKIIVCIDTIPSNKKPQYPYELDVKECKKEKW